MNSAAVKPVVLEVSREKEQKEDYNELGIVTQYSMNFKREES